MLWSRPPVASVRRVTLQAARCCASNAGDGAGPVAAGMDLIAARSGLSFWSKREGREALGWCWYR